MSNNPTRTRFALVDDLKDKTLFEKYRIFLKFRLNNWRYFEAIFCVTILVDNVPTKTIAESDLLCLYRL